jgi:hypothetical protein
VPLILIPQLIFGGALIKYEEMNRDPGILYTFQRWFASKKQPTDMEGDKKLSVPMISRYVATHYSYEALVVAQAKHNPLAIRQQRLQEKIEEFAAKQNRTEAEDERLEDLKETLVHLSGLESDIPSEVDKRLSRVDRIIQGRKPAFYDFRSRGPGVTADQLYTNQKIDDMVAKAETEQNDYRRTTKINPFFSPEKYHFRLGSNPDGIGMSIYFRNGAMLILSSLILLVILWQVLRVQLKKTGV